MNLLCIKLCYIGNLRVPSHAFSSLVLPLLPIWMDMHIIDKVKTIRPNCKFDERFRFINLQKFRRKFLFSFFSNTWIILLFFFLVSSNMFQCWFWADSKLVIVAETEMYLLLFFMCPCLFVLNCGQMLTQILFLC